MAAETTASRVFFREFADAVDALGARLAVEVAQEWIDAGQLEPETAVATLQGMSRDYERRARSMNFAAAWVFLVEKWEREALLFELAADRIGDLYDVGMREAAE